MQLTGIDKNTPTQRVSRLIERGLLARRRAAHDARTNAVNATPAAVALLDAIMPQVRRVQRQILEPIPEDLRETFSHCLRSIVHLEA